MPGFTYSDLVNHYDSIISDRAKIVWKYQRHTEYDLKLLE
jgi:hypothetical protein